MNDKLSRAIKSLSQTDSPIPEKIEFLRLYLQKIGGMEAFVDKIVRTQSDPDTTPATQSRLLEWLVKMFDEAKASEDASSQLEHMTLAELEAKAKMDFPWLAETNADYQRWVAAGRPVPADPAVGQGQVVQGQSRPVPDPSPAEGDGGPDDYCL